MSKSLLISTTLLTIFLIVRCFETTFNYCQFNTAETAHIACGHSGQLEESCDIGDGGGIVYFEPEEIRMIVHMHNKIRNDVAGGKHRFFLRADSAYPTGGLYEYFPAADRMPQLEWDEELAYLAALNAERCIEEHDGKRSTTAFPRAGQNWYRVSNKSGNEGYPGITFSIDRGINKWISESDDVRQTDGDTCFESTGDTIYHFTAIILDKANRIGCAALRYRPVREKPTDKFKYRFYLVCNYSYMNVKQRKVYLPVKKGGSPGDGCKTKTDRTYINLCNKDEVVDAKRSTFDYICSQSNPLSISLPDSRPSSQEEAADLPHKDKQPKKKEIRLTRSSRGTTPLQEISNQPKATEQRTVSIPKKTDAGKITKNSTSFGKMPSRAHERPRTPPSSARRFHPSNYYASNTIYIN